MPCPPFYPTRSGSHFFRDITPHPGPAAQALLTLTLTAVNCLGPHPLARRAQAVPGLVPGLPPARVRAGEGRFTSPLPTLLLSPGFEIK